MKDQSFDVSPGTHTLVGVKQYKVEKVLCFLPFRLEISFNSFKSQVLALACCV